MIKLYSEWQSNKAVCWQNKTAQRIENSIRFRGNNILLPTAC